MNKKKKKNLRKTVVPSIKAHEDYYNRIWYQLGFTSVCLWNEGVIDYFGEELPDFELTVKNITKKITPWATRNTQKEFLHGKNFSLN